MWLFLFQAIMEVGEVIQFYDSDRRFPAWGFGGRTADGHVSHAFNLNGAPYGDEVKTYETKILWLYSGWCLLLQNWYEENVVYTEPW